MRILSKISGIFMTVALIVAGFALTVSAEPSIYSGETQNFDWYLDHDGLMTVKCKTGIVYIEDVGEEILEKTSQVLFDISDLDCSKEYLYFFGSGSSITTVSVSNGENDYIIGLYFYDFPRLDETGLAIPRDIHYQSVGFSNVALGSLKYLKNIDISNIHMTGCNSIKILEIPASVKGLSVDSCDNLEEIIFSGEMNSLELSGMDKLHVDIPDNITEVRWYHCPVSELTIPAAGTYQISSDRGLKKVIISSGRTAINDSMFSTCKELEETELPDTLESIGNFAFFLCSGLKELNIPESVTAIGQGAFSMSGLESFKIPSGVTVINGQTFEACASLKSVTIPSGVNSIFETAFNGCDLLKEVYYEGTEEQWEMIKVVRFGRSGIVESQKSLEDVFGDAVIHFAKKSGWLQKDSVWLYLDKCGEPVTGWQKITGNWYYFDDEGIMQTGWIKDNGLWYYLSASGSMVTNWQNIESSWYYFGENGVMRTDWQMIGDFWYYFGGNGSMRAGWQQIKGNWYFLKTNGSMAANEYCNGYWLNSNGTWTYQYKASWQQNSKGWWYGDNSGWYAKNTQFRIDGTVYSFDSNGYWIR